MKVGKSLTELAQEIDRQSQAKKDYVAPVSKLAAVVETVGSVPQIAINLQGQETFPVSPYAHGQLAEYLEIPKTYYDRCAANAPQLLADQVNRWLADKAVHKRKNGTVGDRRLVRTLDGLVRAILSDGYRRLENEDLANAVLPVIQDLNLLILSCEITERRLYIKAVDSSIVKDLPEGFVMGDGSHKIFDTVSPSITIGNSEVGAGGWFVESGVFTKGCTNLALFGAQLRKYHTGARAELSDDVYEVLSDQTKAATDQAIVLQTRDIVRASFNEAQFEATTKKLISAHSDTISRDADVVEVVERVKTKFGFTDQQKSSVLKHLILGGDLSRYGLHAAVTRTAEDLADYDEATRFERVGGEIIELPRNQWEELARAA